MASQSGYAQLDFDNVVIEEEDDCKKRWQQICQEIKGFTIPNTKEKKMDYNGLSRVDFINWEDSALWKHYDYDNEIPEEVYCKALEMLFDTSLIDGKEEEIGNYSIKKISFEGNDTYYYSFVFSHYMEIRDPKGKHYDLGFTLYAEDKSLRPIARKLLEILT